jgi:5'-3' exonuclease
VKQPLKCLDELLAVLPNADGAVSPRRFRAIIISPRFATRRRSGVSGDE